jgi:hypothetical protein
MALSWPEPIELLVASIEVAISKLRATKVKMINSIALEEVNLITPPLPDISASEFGLVHTAIDIKVALMPIRLMPTI